MRFWIEPLLVQPSSMRRQAEAARMIQRLMNQRSISPGRPSAEPSRVITA
jgi:hypothetical protein